MPEAVASWIEEHDFDKVRAIQNDILLAYENDFAKHAPTNQVMKITAVWKQIYKQLAKENKKFIFSAIRKSARGRDYEEAIHWLLSAGLILKSHRVDTPKLPIKAYANSEIFKLFLLDVGLLGAQAQLPAKTMIEGDRLFSEFKGALTENLIAQELSCKETDALYYWASVGTAELDFLIEKEDIIYPLEVKSCSSKKKKSLRVYEEKYTPQIVCRASVMNLKKEGKLINYPLYLMHLFPISPNTP